MSAEQMNAGRVDDELGVAFRLLGDSVAVLRSSLLRSPTASEVRLHLKEATYNGFDPKRLGFSRFRDFLAEAQRQGYVTLDDSHPGDIAVGGPDDQTRAVAEPAVRRDLWKAVTDWSPDLEHYFDLEEDRVASIPKAARPLEPARIRDLRSEVQFKPERYLRIPSLPWARQSALMREFASSPALKPDLRKLLIAALDQEKPTRSWQAVLRIDHAAYVAWQRFMKSRVEEHLAAWQQDSPAASRVTIARKASSQDAADPSPRRAEAQQPDVSELLRLVAASVARNPELEVPLPEGRQLKQDRQTVLGERQLRLLAQRAVEHMPIEELRRLAIPLGYLFPE